MIYKIQSGPSPARSSVEAWLTGLDLVSQKMRDNIVTAWVTTWQSSTHKNLDDMPWDIAAPKYRLAVHVNEVTRLGLSFAKEAAREWGYKINFETLVPMLCLHDVDKPLMFERLPDGTVVKTKLYHRLYHGIVGGMLLKELEFDEMIISNVASHSPRMPYHDNNYEAYLLHYSDQFACDNAMLAHGLKPLFNYLKLPDLLHQT